MLIMLACTLCLTGCGMLSATPKVQRIALFAPFEGRYREIGYNALYAARLALADSGNHAIELLAVDDGGTAETAALHLQAIEQDSSVIAAIGLGYHAAEPATQQVLGDLPYLIVGYWAEDRAAENSFILANAAIRSAITIPATISITEAARLDAPFSGGEVIGLKGFASLRDNLRDITLITSGSLPDAAFRERYLASDLYVPEPNHLATLVYDAVNFIVAGRTGSRDEALGWLNTGIYAGINGEISFSGGWWQHAPLNRYEFSAERALVAEG